MAKTRFNGLRVEYEDSDYVHVRYDFEALRERDRKAIEKAYEIEFGLTPKTDEPKPSSIDAQRCPHGKANAGNCLECREQTKMQDVSGSPDTK